MDAIELARRLAAHGETEAACRAYTLALDGGADPGGQMEAAVYLFQAGGDYRIAYGCFRDLYNQGHFQKECLAIMTQAFYEPNIKSLEKRYKKIADCLSEIDVFITEQSKKVEQLKAHKKGLMQGLLPSLEEADI